MLKNTIQRKDAWTLRVFNKVPKHSEETFKGTLMQI